MKFGTFHWCKGAHLDPQDVLARVSLRYMDTAVLFLLRSASDCRGLIAQGNFLGPDGTIHHTNLFLVDKNRHET